MKQYLALMQDIVDNGVDRNDRTGVGTRSVFGRQLRYDLASGFPLMTTKKIHLKSIIHELIWFLSGDTNIGYLNDNGVRIWNEWADDNGDLHEVYGKQWRAWDDTRAISETEYRRQQDDFTARGFELLHCYNGTAVIQRKVDQVADVVHALQHNPQSRRIILSGWNAAKIEEMALPPCHTLYQFYVAEGKLSCELYQRSADFFLGVPFNTAEAALLTHMLAQQCELAVGELVHSFGDVHLYHNHLTDDIVYEQLRRTPKALPQLLIKRKPASIFDYQFDDFEFVGYDPEPVIKAQVAV
ncbi:thymidylate synthase [Gallaecimonas sp. GXIMD1310]|uniref:thymidylate synthase n=1 Tax=Gallaecimonas sp. GXIMD1310 TaxID=3131926 RepID=UPI0032558F4D